MRKPTGKVAFVDRAAKWRNHACPGMLASSVMHGQASDLHLSGRLYRQLKGRHQEIIESQIPLLSLVLFIGELRHSGLQVVMIFKRIRCAKRVERALANSSAFGDPSLIRVPAADDGKNDSGSAYGLRADENSEQTAI